MPPRNAPLPNAVNLFNCGICDKGYPRQTDYENHLRSYDHNHRQRLADMKKLTDANAPDSSRAQRSQELRIISQGATPAGGAAKQGLGRGFKKLGGSTAATPGGTGFKKLGGSTPATTTGGTGFKKLGESAPAKPEDKPKDSQPGVSQKDAAAPAADAKSSEATQQTGAANVEDKDKPMQSIEQEEDDVITWEEYDVTKPSDCDHANCLGCKGRTDAVYENGWLVMGSA